MACAKAAEARSERQAILLLQEQSRLGRATVDSSVGRSARVGGVDNHHGRGTPRKGGPCVQRTERSRDGAESSVALKPLPLVCIVRHTAARR